MASAAAISIDHLPGDGTFAAALDRVVRGDVACATHLLMHEVAR
jgi:hypothetical protein